MNVLELSEQEIIRRNSLNELRAMGIEPYPAAEYVTNAFSTDIKAEFKDDAVWILGYGDIVCYANICIIYYTLGF